MVVSLGSDLGSLGSLVPVTQRASLVVLLNLSVVLDAIESSILLLQPPLWCWEPCVTAVLVAGDVWSGML